MSCRKVAEIISRQTEGELLAEEHAALGEHLIRCDRCASEWGALQHVDRLLASAALVEPPATLTARVMLGVARHRRRQARWRACRTFLYVLAGGLALVATPVLSVGALLRDNPAMVDVVLTLFAKGMVLANAVTGAIETLARAALGRQLGLVAVGWVTLTALLLVGWLRLVAGRGSQRWGGPDLAS